MKLRIHSQTSKMQPLKSRNGYGFYPALYWVCDYLSTLGWASIHVNSIFSHGSHIHFYLSSPSLDNRRSLYKVCLIRYKHVKDVLCVGVIHSSIFPRVDTLALRVAYDCRSTGEVAPHVEVKSIAIDTSITEMILMSMRCRTCISMSHAKYII